MEVKFYEKEGKEFFFLSRPSACGAPAIPFVFDAPAEDSHRKEYASAYKAFLKSKAPVEAPVVEEVAEVKTGWLKKSKKSA